MLSNYVTTALEDWITTWYIRNKIMQPNDLKLSLIARKHEVYIHYKELPPRYDIFGRYKAITLDKRCSLEEQREQFFHELCHILRHCGRQSMMPEAFRQLQEWDAQRFTIYAALPLHMIRRYDLTDPDIVFTLSDDFKVSQNLCKQRLESIKRRLTVVNYYSKFSETTKINNVSSL